MARRGGMALVGCFLVVALALACSVASAATPPKTTLSPSRVPGSAKGKTKLPPKTQYKIVTNRFHKRNYQVTCTDTRPKPCMVSCPPNCPNKCLVACIYCLSFCSTFVVVAYNQI